jgi:AcrR family transcriptional regulator
MARPRKFYKEKVLAMATLLAEGSGYQNVTRENIAILAETSPGTVSGLFGSMDQLKEEIIKYSIKNKNLIVLSQALAARNRLAMCAPPELKQQAAEAMIK